MRGFGRDILVYGGADAAMRLAQLAAIPLLTRAFSVEQFGILAILQVTVSLVGTLGALGVGFAVQRLYFERQAGQQRRSLVTGGIVQLLVTAAITLVVALAFAMLFDGFALDAGVPIALLALAILTALPDQVAQYSLDISRLQFSPWQFVLIAFVKNLGALVLGLYLATEAALGVAGMMWGALAASSLAALFGLLLVRRDLGATSPGRESREFLAIGAPFVMTAVAYWLFSSIDRWLLGWLASTREAGLFSIAMKFAAILTMAIGAFHQAWVPTAMRMRHDDPDYRRRIAELFASWAFLMSWMAFGLTLFSGTLLRLFTPAEYWPAAPVLALCGAGLAMSGMIQMTSLGPYLEKRTLLMAMAAWGGAILNIALGLLLIPGFGAFGAALSLLLTYAFLNAAYLWQGQRLHPFPLDWRSFLLPLVLVAAALTTVFFGVSTSLEPTGLGLRALLLAIPVVIALRLGLFSREVVESVLPWRVRAT